MAGKPKKRIDYAGWSVDIFSNDTKIDMLIESQGWSGFGVYFYLCQMAFGSEGYFYEWGYTLCATTARKMGGGIGAGTVRETVDYCLQIGLFDKGLFDRWGVLTSRGIQKSYVLVLKSKNRNGTKLIKEYWLLDDEETNCQDVIFVRKNQEKIEENGYSLGENDHSLGENDHSLAQKKSKVKDSKENNIFVATPAKPKQTTATFSVDSFEIKCVDLLIDSCIKSFPKSKVPRTLSEKQKWAIDIDRMKRIDGRTEEDITKALKYAISDTFWQGNIRSTKKLREKFETLIVGSQRKIKQSRKNGFNDFRQNEYDFEELEKELLSN